MRLQRTLVLVLATIVSVLAAYIVVGQQFAFGPVLVEVTRNHGVHLADVTILGLWAIGMGVCSALWLKPPPRD